MARTCLRLAQADRRLVMMAVSVTLGRFRRKGLISYRRHTVPVQTNKERALHIRRGTLEDRHVLFDVWLRSVEATHAFVSDTDIEAFKPLVRDYLAST